VRLLKCLFFGGLAFVWAQGPLLAQSSPSLPPTAGGKKQNPIEVYFTTLSGLRYIQEDQLLSDQELEAILSAQGDPESLRMIKQSKNSSSLSIWGLGLGLPVMATGVIAATDNTKDPRNVAVGLGAALGGFCLAAAGTLLSSEGKTAKFNSVQRYNQVVEGAGTSAGDTAAKSQDLKIQPIDVRLTTLGGWEYSVQGRKMAWPKDFESRLDGLNDFEVSRMLKKSKSSGLLSQIFMGLGIGGEIATIALNSGSKPGGDRIGFWFPLIGSFLAFESSTYFQMEAATAEFNAVKRYNRFAQGKEQVLPQGPQDEKSLLNFNTPSETPNK
jgi:hypothetical protein